jgi:hypothetical protein
MLPFLVYAYRVKGLGCVMMLLHLKCFDGRLRIVLCVWMSFDFCNFWRNLFGLCIHGEGFMMCNDVAAFEVF